MTYTDSEKSKHSGKPLELYRYNGTYQVFRYTSSPVPVMYQAPDEAEQFEYVPLTTKRSAVQHTTQNDDTSEVTIDLPVTSELVAIYGFQISPPDLYLTIFRGHNPGEYIRYWQGNVENISVVRGTATIRVPSPLASALSADFPNVYYQTPCNHNLGDAQCKVDLDDWLVTTAVVTAPGKVINVTAVGAMDGKLVGGDAVLASGERRMIVSQAANAITVNYPFANANPGDTITLIAGCDLAFAGDCDTKFDNTINFGGFPFIPSENIFQTGLEPGKSVADNSCLPPMFDGWYIRIRISWINLLAPEPGLGCFLYRGEGSSVDRSSQVPYEYIEWEQDWEGSYDVQDSVIQSQYGGTQNSTTKARVTYRRWDDAEYSVALPQPGSDTFDEGGGWWDVYGIGPVTNNFTF